MPSAAVVGSGPNGLVGAIALARAGYDVDVYEAADGAGGGLRSAALTLPGFTHDICAAVLPLGRASPALAALELPLEWVESPAAAAHPFDDAPSALLERGLEDTAAGLGRDAQAYRRL